MVSTASLSRRMTVTMEAGSNRQFAEETPSTSTDTLIKLWNLLLFVKPSVWNSHINKNIVAWKNTKWKNVCVQRRRTQNRKRFLLPTEVAHWWQQWHKACIGIHNSTQQYTTVHIKTFPVPRTQRGSDSWCGFESNSWLLVVEPEDWEPPQSNKVSRSLLWIVLQTHTLGLVLGSFTEPCGISGSAEVLWIWLKDFDCLSLLLRVFKLLQYFRCSVFHCEGRKTTAILQHQCFSYRCPRRSPSGTNSHIWPLRHSDRRHTSLCPRPPRPRPPRLWKDLQATAEVVGGAPPSRQVWVPSHNTMGSVSVEEEYSNTLATR